MRQTIIITGKNKLDNFTKAKTVKHAKHVHPKATMRTLDLSRVIGEWIGSTLGWLKLLAYPSFSRCSNSQHKEACPTTLCLKPVIT